jgi:hypothetical protein
MKVWQAPEMPAFKRLNLVRDSMSDLAGDENEA